MNMKRNETELKRTWKGNECMKNASSNQPSNQPIKQTIKSINQWMNQSMSQWINDSLNQWVNELHLPWATNSLNQVFSKPPRRWATSSLRYLFSQLLWAAFYLDYFFPISSPSFVSELPLVSATSSLSYSGSFCKPILLFAQPWAWHDVVDMMVGQAHLTSFFLMAGCWHPIHCVSVKAK